ncbi:MAG: UDP-N-acetylmuramate--L-alanine ligase [Actinomyces sp.]|nr:MAG: UDP-N-acetylmuramate--L-alanine ligase [Actinomyces sp.]
MNADASPLTPDELDRPRRIHVIGAGGAGMGAIATVLVAQGHAVTGSDLKDGPVPERLRALGVPVAVGHDPANVGDAEFVAVSTAIPDHNPELRAAREAGIRVLRRADLLPALCARRRTIAVAGTHGKTTTSSMLALILVEAGLDPSFVIGGDVNEVGSGAAWSEGEWLVIEADESDRTFLSLGAEIAIVTTVEPDHLETYGGDPARLAAAFATFAAAAPRCVVCADDPGARALAETLDTAVTYGTAEGADLRLVDVERWADGIAFGVVWNGEHLGRIELPVPGLHNALDAGAAVAAALLAGAPFAAAVAALGRFGGVARRFEWRGEADGVTFVDDYAHLPSEVKAAIAAARDGEWRRVVVVFQPHRYSRTAALWRDFADAFTGADLLAITGIYPAGERPRPGVTGKLVVDAVLEAHPWASVAWLPTLEEVAAWLTARLRPGDLCLTLGAGDLTTLPDRFVSPVAEGVG